MLLIVLLLGFVLPNTTALALAPFDRDAGTASDIDIAVRLEAGFAKGGFEYLGKLERLREQLAEILGRPVDVIEEPVEAQPLQHAIDRERLPAF